MRECVPGGPYSTPFPKLMSEFRPVACICTKFSLLLSIVTERLDCATEDYGLLDDTQEGFRRNRNTKRQLGRKLRSMLAEQCRRKQSLSVVLYLDIRNAFNAVNHRAIFYILEAKGFPQEDIQVALFRRMYRFFFGHVQSIRKKRNMCAQQRYTSRGSAQPLNLRLYFSIRSISLHHQGLPAWLYAAE